jgi:hypothetical protein
MLDFISHYPIDHYLKTLLNPTKNNTRVGVYLSRDFDYLLIKEKKTNLYWTGNLRDVNGAPSLENTFQKKLDSAKSLLPSVYKRVLQKEQKINRGNEILMIVDDPEMFITPYSVSNHENAGELEAALARDPASLITAWKNYNHTAEFNWDILNSRCEIVRDKTRLTKRVILCGFPEQRAIHTAKWCNDHKQELAGLIPVIPSIIHWGLKYCPPTGCFLLINTTYEIAICYLENKEIKVLSTQKTRDGFSSDEVSDVHELVEEMGVDKKNVNIWCWDILPGSNAFTKLQSRYPNTLSLTPDVLEKIHPLTAKKEETTIKQHKEAWLLDHILN